MADIAQAGTFALGALCVKRVGYGAMQLAGPGVFGAPKDRDAAIAVLREAIEHGVNHIDTSDYYGPHVIVTKLGAKRGLDGSWQPAFSPEALTSAVHDNLRNLKLDVLDRSAALGALESAVAGAHSSHRLEQRDAEAGGLKNAKRTTHGTRAFGLRFAYNKRPSAGQTL